MRLQVRRWAILSIAPMAAGLGQTLPAQARYEVGGTLALYSPTGSYNTGIICTCLPSSPEDLRSRALGGQLRYWFSSTWGVQLAGSVSAPYTFGGYTGPWGSNITPYYVARVRLMTVQALATVVDRPGLGRVWLGMGAGVVQHFGSAYEQDGNPVSPGGVVGMGGTIRIVSGLSLQAGLESLWYYLNLAPGGQTVSRGLQTDLLFATGLTWGWQ